MPTSPDNTSNMDTAGNLLFLAGSMGPAGASGAIEAMEAAGQRQFVGSQVIPTRIHHGTDADLTNLGFGLGDVVDGDPLFRHATLPGGWTRQGDDHAMWSYIIDGLGRRRMAVFYKAASYDRDAFGSVITVDGYLYDCVYGTGSPVLDGTWATRDKVRAGLESIRAEKTSEAASCRAISAGDPYWAGRAADFDKLAARCDVLLTELEEDPQ